MQSSISVGRADPQVADALACLAAGDRTAASEICEAIIARSPSDAAALHLRGALAHQDGDSALGAELIDRAIELEPSNPRFHFNRGAIADALGHLSDAATYYGLAAQLAPYYADAWFRQGDMLARLGRSHDALEACNSALALAPERANWVITRGNILKQLGRFDEALADYDRALMLDPARTDALTNRGSVLAELGRYEQALESYGLALDISPSSAAHYNRGNLLSRLGRWPAAIADYDASMRLAGDDPVVTWNRGLARLSCGRFREGWADYEFRWRLPTWAPMRPTDKPMWLGNADILGRTVLIWGEQGFGDKLQFVRYASLLAARGARVLLETDKSLVSLLRSVPGVSAITSTDAPFPDDAFDYHCPMLSLPLGFDTTLCNLPSDLPYVTPSARVAENWRLRVGGVQAPRIGLVWSGNTVPDPGRSIPLVQLGRILEPTVSWISLQREVRPSDREALAALPQINHFGDDLVDFEETAGLCAACDLVISIDTSVAHLSAAMNKSVWILLPKVADWRWMECRDETPWYPGARLFRQSRPGDWDDVIDRIERELAMWRTRFGNLAPT